MEKEKKYKTIITILVLVIVAVIAYNIGNNNNSATGNAIVPTTGGNPTPTAKLEISSGDHVLGDENAPVKIIEYSDFQCPYCSRFYNDALQSIKSEYVDTGKAVLVYRHFPLSSIHPMAQPAAEASECAAEQGMFWEYHNMLFENQALLSNENLKKWATDLGLDTDKFNDCFDSGKYKSKVQSDYQSGIAAGVKGTPATFVDGVLVSGAQPFAAFQQAIEANL